MPDHPLRLTLKLDGPLVEAHRLPLSELLRIGKQLRNSLRDVAVVLTHRGPSGTSGRSKKEIENAADLQVVGAPRAGSFALDLEMPPIHVLGQEGLPGDLGPTLSEQAALAFIDGLHSLDVEAEELPLGFDRGVLRAVVPFQTALKRGITEIVLDARSEQVEASARIDSDTIKVAQRLIRQPVTADAVVEGVLQMVDFGSLACRIDRPPMSSVSVSFQEKDRDLVHKAVRQVVRVSGPAKFEPYSNEPDAMNASSITILYEALELDVNAFWNEKGIAALSEEQKTPRFAVPKQLEADPWRNDEEAAQLVKAIRSWD
jgi:hypothetical protein